MPDRTYMDFVTSLLAVDAKNLTDIMRKLMKPGIMSTDSTCCQATVDAPNKKVTFAALAAGEAVFTHYAFCEEFYETEIQFSVADASGNYRIYLDAHDPGNSPNNLVKFRVWPRKQIAAIDTDLYVWICTVSWDQATQTLGMGFQQERPFGVFQLGKVGRGGVDEAAIQSGEQLTLESGADLVGENGSLATFDHAKISDLLTFMDNTDIVSGDGFHWDMQGDSEIDASAVALLLLMGQNSALAMGMLSVILMDSNTSFLTGSDFLLQMGAAGKIEMGQDPVVDLGNNADIDLAGDANIDMGGDAVIDTGNNLALDLGDGSELTAGVATWLKFLNGLKLRSHSSGTPDQYELSRSNIVTAMVTYDGATQTVLRSYNVSGVVRNAQGDYTVSFDRNYTAFNYFPLVSTNEHLAGINACTSTQSELAGSIIVNTSNGGAGAADRTFTLICFGGVQVP
ncbi:hypothetical protein KAU45_04795 [bacterium]|nr:hypothetical protein [bacterium]